MKVIIDTDELKFLVDEEFKWDKEHKKECGWNDNDLAMIAEGMHEAMNKIIEMVYVKNTAKKVVYCKDCKYNDGVFCIYHKTVIDENGFCSRGERR